MALTLLQMAQALVAEGICSSLPEAYTFLEDMGLDKVYPGTRGI